MSGAEISLLATINNLSPELIKAYLILPNITDFSEKVNSKVSIIRAPVTKLGYRHIFNIRVWFKVLKATTLITREVQKKKIDIVYCNTITALIYCVPLKLLSKVKIICHCRDYISSKFLKLLIAVLCNKVICVSNFIKNSLLPECKRKAALCYVGIDTDYYQRIYPKTNNNANKREFVIANIGQAVEWKKQAHFLEIASRISKEISNVRFHLVIYGMFDSSEKQVELLKNKIKELDLLEYITVSGFQNDIRQILSEADLLIHTAKNEPFGRIVAEALSLQVPVIATSVGGPVEIIRTGKNGYLVKDMDIKTVVEKVRYMLNHPDERKKFGELGRQTIINNFNLKDHVKRTESILFNV